MKNLKEPLTGVIRTDKKDYVFHLKEYSVDFFDNETGVHDLSTIAPVNGFVKATTHQEYEVLIYTGEDSFHIANTMKLNIASYIVSKSNTMDLDLSFFDGIEFVGGTIANLKIPQDISFEFDSETKRHYVVKKGDEIKFSFSTEDFTCEVEIASNTSMKQGNKGNSITNNEIYIRMMFDKKQSTISLYKHYGKIQELLSFLTYRQNVGFEKIYLIQRECPIHNIARVFVKQEFSLTNKKHTDAIKFDRIKNYLPNLLTMLYTTTDGKPSYSLNIYPESDAKSTYITNELIREICSSLECEVSFVKEIKSDEATKIKALRKKLQEVINEHKNSPDKLMPKTYGLIEGSMGHWSMSASDQIKALFHIYQEEMDLINDPEDSYGDDEIDYFVKYRNDITHGSYRVMDLKIARMAYLLTHLVYCSVLTRIGVPRKQITKLCQENRLWK